MVVVATALLMDARSKRVAGLTSKSSPLRLRSGQACREERDKDGAPSEFVSYVKLPNGLSATKRSRCVIAMEAAGKARAEIASSRSEKA